jgi:hypothetical protein
MVSVDSFVDHVRDVVTSSVILRNVKYNLKEVGSLLGRDYIVLPLHNGDTYIQYVGEKENA